MNKMKKAIKIRLLSVFVSCVLVTIFLLTSSALYFTPNPTGSLEGNDYTIINVTGIMYINENTNNGYASIIASVESPQNYIYQKASIKVQYTNGTWSPNQSNYRIGTITQSETVNSGILNFGTMSLDMIIYTFSISSDADTWDRTFIKYKGLDF